MKYVQINATATAWAKSIIFGKHRELLSEGHDSYVFWGRKGGGEDEFCKRFATDLDVYADALATRLDGKPGFHSKRSTARLLAKLDEINPDVVHLHVLTGYYVNVEMLFEWLAIHDCKVIWTLHDCWSFTGHCIYFTYVKCMQWQNHCGKCMKCPQPDTYPQTLRRGMEPWNFEQKKRLFTLMPRERMSLTTPSQWLADLVRQSYMGKYDVQVIHNNVDTAIFKQRPSNFRERYGIGNRFLILGVASIWSERKGLDCFVRLAQALDSDRYAIVLVGLSRKQIKRLSKTLIALPRTESARELAEAYTAADVHVQPSSEETFGMTVAEAAACGTPVVVAEGSACIEAVGEGVALAIPPDMSSLEATIVNLAEGHLD